MRNLRTAFGLLTTLPLGLPEHWLPGDSGRAAIWYPLVGFVIGGLTWLSWLALTAFFPSADCRSADAPGMGRPDRRPASRRSG
jgi:Cobalamin-5-phosphate synthase